jgi:REP element-mobilizing transposase RayT
MPFQPFEREADFEIYRINLPHWRQPGSTYFVTWRLVDSLPQVKLDALHAERIAWLRAHGIPDGGDIAALSAKHRTEYHRLFTARIHEWLDAGMGACHLRAPRCAAPVAEALRHFDGDRYALDAFVVMPNHVHALVAPAPGWRLEQVLHSWKGYTSNVLNRLLGRRGALWQQESWDHIVRSAAHLEHFRRYIRENPVKAGLPEGEFVLQVEGASSPLSPTPPAPL